LYATNQTGEVIGTEPDVIVLVQNALVGLIGIIGGYFGGKFQGRVAMPKKKRGVLQDGWKRIAMLRRKNDSHSSSANRGFRKV
jgi:hypothetical protein